MKTPKPWCQCERCDPPPPPVSDCPWMFRYTWVYYALDRSGRILYIGSTHNVESRFGEHRRKAPWFADTVRWRMSGPYEPTSAHHLEYAEIYRHQPVYNILGKNRPLLEVVS